MSGVIPVGYLDIRASSPDDKRALEGVSGLHLCVAGPGSFETSRSEVIKRRKERKIGPIAFGIGWWFAG
ncbi:hypothetical protein HYQ46_009847 [Verticillium longisporum]|nr:hypothetical protein HYQ46_009847 [Verticillium longisporum]